MSEILNQSIETRLENGLYRPDRTSEELPAFYGLPNEVSYCKRCVISNQRPNSAIEFKHTSSSKKSPISIVNNGLCVACETAEEKENFNW